MITSNQVERLVLTHKDRLLRFGSELIFALCEQFGCEVVIINRSDESSFEDDLTQDVLEIITVFSARLYGSRSHKNKKIVEQLRKVAIDRFTRKQDKWYIKRTGKETIVDVSDRPWPVCQITDSYAANSYNSMVAVTELTNRFKEVTSFQILP